MKIRILFLLCALCGLTWVAPAQDMPWEEYAPTSTLVVPEHPLTKAKYAFVDVHAHQWRIGQASAEDVATLVGDMDAMNMGVMINLSGGQRRRPQAEGPKR